MGAPIAFQINRCLLEPPLEEDLILTQIVRSFVTHCRLRDRTGGVAVDVAHTAVPFLFGCFTDAELKEHVRAQSLTSVRQRMDVRGALREEGDAREDTLQWRRRRRLMREHLLAPCVSAQVCATPPRTL